MIGITKDDAFEIVDTISKAREIVFCKDCVYWAEQGYCSRFDLRNMCPIATDGAMHMPMDADDFCSRGEKKDEID